MVLSGMENTVEFENGRVLGQAGSSLGTEGFASRSRFLCPAPSMADFLVGAQKPAPTMPNQAVSGPPVSPPPGTMTRTSLVRGLGPVPLNVVFLSPNR